MVSELATRTGEWPEWNFHKYLLDRSGQQVQSFAAGTDPGDPAVTGLIEKWLKTQ